MAITPVPENKELPSHPGYRQRMEGSLSCKGPDQFQLSFATCYTKTMSILSSDTHPKVEALQIEFWRQASPTRKMQILAQLNTSARTLALAGLRTRYPKASDAELRRRLAGLLLGEELARKVYGELDYAK